MTFDEARAAMAAVLDGQVHPGVLLAGEGVEHLAGFAAALRERCVLAPTGARPVVWCAEDIPRDVSVAAAALAAAAGAEVVLRDDFPTASFCPDWEVVRDVAGSVEKLLAPVRATAYIVGVEAHAERFARVLCRLDVRRALVLAPTRSVELCDGALSELELPDAEPEALTAGVRLYATWLAPTPAAGVARAAEALAGATSLRPAA